MQKPISLLVVGFLATCSLSACGAQQAERHDLNVVFVSGSNEYFSHISLPDYEQYLEGNFDHLNVTLLQAEGDLNEREEYSELPGVEALEEADVALFFSRRLTVDGEQLDHLKRYVDGGGGVVALRTASHGFQNWLEFDKDVLGGNYNGHYEGSSEGTIIYEEGNRLPDGEPTGPTTRVVVNPAFADHPVLAGVTDFESRYSLYKTSPVAHDVEVLMTGTIPDGGPEPVVWIRQHDGGRVVYIAQGGLQDFENPTFRQLVTNALRWAAGENDVSPRS